MAFFKRNKPRYTERAFTSYKKRMDNRYRRQMQSSQFAKAGPKGRGFPWMTALIIFAIIILFPYLKRILKSVGSWMERTLGFLSGDGGAGAQAQQEAKVEAAEKMNEGFKKWNISPSVSDYNDAAQIMKWNDESRNTFSTLGLGSLWSTNVPHEYQIKVLNLLGFCVPDGEYMYYPAGHKDKLYPNILKDFNKNVDRYRLAGIIKAYGSPPLPNRQTPFIGLLFEDTRGTLPKQIQEFYSKEYADLFLPYIYETINFFQ